MIVVLIALGVALGGGKGTSSASSSSAASTPCAASSPALTSAQQQFVSAMRGLLSFSASVTDSGIARVGADVCSRASVDSDQAAPEQATQADLTNLSAADAYNVVRLAEQDLCPAYLPAQTWHTIATFTGSADTSTAQFTIQPYNGGNWVMKYTYDCSGQLGGQGNFIVNEDGEKDTSGTSSPAQLNNLDSGQTSQTYVYNDAGAHYLAIQTECPYTITVRQKY